MISRKLLNQFKKYGKLAVKDPRDFAIIMNKRALFAKAKKLNLSRNERLAFNKHYFKHWNKHGNPPISLLEPNYVANWVKNNREKIKFLKNESLFNPRIKQFRLTNYHRRQLAKKRRLKAGRVKRAKEKKALNEKIRKMLLRGKNDGKKLLEESLKNIDDFFKGK